MRAQSVQGYATLAVARAAAPHGTPTTAEELRSDALGTGAASSLDRFTHGAAECHPGCELFSYALGNKLCIGLGVTHLEDVQLYLLTGELFELTANAVRFGTMTADNNSGASSVNIYSHTVAGALNLDLGNSGTLQARRQNATDFHVFANIVAVTLAILGAVGEPTRPVVSGDSESVTERVNLLSHYRALPCVLVVCAPTTS